MKDISSKDIGFTFIGRKLLVTVIVAVTAIIFLCVLCRVSNPITYSLFMDNVDRYPSGGDFDPDYYRIDTNTIFTSLDTGNLSAFSPTTEIPDNFWPEGVSYFQWYQSDFMRIASDLNQLAGNDSISDWRLFAVSFESRCENNGDGFSAGRLVFFRPIWINNQLHYEARQIHINPLVGVVSWGDGATYPRPLEGWDEIRLDQFEIPAEKAFMIAEENGGTRVRFDQGYKCNISVVARADYWIVLYSGRASTEYGIDAYTGKIVPIRDN